MTKKHTPAPWTLDGDRLKGKRDIPTFAVIHGIASSPDHIQQHKHNMNLIKAAPDLLEALDDIVKCEMNRREDFKALAQKPANLYEFSNKRVQNALKAIKKALEG